MAKKKTHGGRRQGSGRRPESGVKLVRCTIYLHPAQIVRAEAAGNGDIGKGVRVILGGMPAH